MRWKPIYPAMPARGTGTAWAIHRDIGKAVINSGTGFEIIDAQIGEPAIVVANRWHLVFDFGEGGCFASTGMFRKISNTTSPLETGKKFSS
jgi:hypothetical protein